MIPLAFIDTETTGVHPDRRVWEVAIIRRDDSGETERVWQVSDVELSNADPFGLKVGGFYDRHALYGDADGIDSLTPESMVARFVEEATRGAHLVGVVPSFDAGCLDPMLRRHRLIPAWHYHLIDVEAMAAGWLHGRTARQNEIVDNYPVENDGQSAPGLVRWDDADQRALPPWKSDDLSRACGVEPPGDDERHTALGDARWAMRWYDALTGGGY